MAWRVIRGTEQEPFDIPLPDMEGQDSISVSALLMRKLLGSISLEDVKTRPAMQDQDRRQYEQGVAAFFPHILKPTIDRLVAAQEQLMARGSQEQRYVGIISPSDQVLFGRGTINGIELVLEEFNEAYQAHIAELTKRGEKFDPRKLFPEIGVDEEE